MKRIYTLAICCLCLMSVYGQMLSETDQSRIATNGFYIFEKAELFIRNIETKEIIEHKIITDIASVDTYSLHWENTFLKVKLWDGYLTELTLADRQEYTIGEGMALEYLENDKKEFQLQMDRAEYIYNGKTLPPYNLLIESKTLVITFDKYSFGRSDYNFTLEAELTLTLTKQNDETDSI